MPQKVRTVTTVVGSSLSLGGGVGGVSLNDNIKSIYDLSPIAFNFWSATDINAIARASFMCQGDWK